LTEDKIGPYFISSSIISAVVKPDSAIGSFFHSVLWQFVMRFLLSLFVIATKSNQKGLGRHDRSAHAAGPAHNSHAVLASAVVDGGYIFTILFHYTF